MQSFLKYVSILCKIENIKKFDVCLLKHKLVLLNLAVMIHTNIVVIRKRKKLSMKEKREND